MLKKLKLIYIGFKFKHFNLQKPFIRLFYKNQKFRKKTKSFEKKRKSHSKENEKKRKKAKKNEKHYI
jgi:hypothetical protein